ncbi:FBP domain-containing protein [Nonomuraea sp. NBC_01738]|uniref:FBP domain-containing protein n=1 Tax=Nonomuraea sp. NBC_01738 TaxID=2976003 RepID=UPI002E14EB80|nr:FBP domain-containing protein [Nonomuraea sp. NBC_01738]
MDPLDDKQLRSSFVNCSKGEASRINLPRDVPWADLDFLGWRDPGAPERGYLVARHRGELVGVTLRFPTDVTRSFTKSTVCSVCVSAHSGQGVALFVAPRAGAPGRQGNTVGTYLCADLRCPLYVRGKKLTDLGMQFETLTLEERVERMTANLGLFLDRVFNG